jgi:hypothetical protein
VKFFSLSRALKDGWSLAEVSSMNLKTKSIMEKVKFTSIDDFDNILSAMVDFMPSS